MGLLTILLLPEEGAEAEASVCFSEVLVAGPEDILEARSGLLCSLILLLLETEAQALMTGTTGNLLPLQVTQQREGAAEEREQVRDLLTSGETEGPEGRAAALLAHRPVLEEPVLLGKEKTEGAPQRQLVERAEEERGRSAQTAAGLPPRWVVLVLMTALRERLLVEPVEELAQGTTALERHPASAAEQPKGVPVPPTRAEAEEEPTIIIFLVRAGRASSSFATH